MGICTYEREGVAPFLVVVVLCMCFCTPLTETEVEFRLLLQCE